MVATKKVPNPVDILVGSKVRLKRKILGFSQEKLGDRLGITFQQVQKYEKGVNRIGASRLQQISSILQVPVSYFFEGLPGHATMRDEIFNESEHQKFIMDFLATSEGIELNQAFAQIKDPKLRKKIIDLVKSLAECEK